jgi:hypothetical protein
MSQNERVKDQEHIGKTEGAKDHDHDMIHDLSKRLDALYRYDQFINNAEGFEDVQAFWKKVKQQEQENITTLKGLIKKHIQSNDF